MVEIAGEITRAALISAYGESAANSVQRKARGRNVLVPSDDHLEIGDVILTKGAKKLPWLPSVETYQRKLPEFAVGEAATWTHAMLYVGRLHVVESTNWFKLSALKWRTGIRVVPLVHTAPGVDYLVCRRRDAASIPDFELLAQSAAVYALMDHAIRRRSYGFERATAVVIASLPKHLRFINRLLPSRFDEAIICSEYVLECLAIGATILTEEWNALNHSNFFLPAHFHGHTDFDKLTMKFVRLTP